RAEHVRIHTHGPRTLGVSEVRTPKHLHRESLVALDDVDAGRGERHRQHAATRGDSESCALVNRAAAGSGARPAPKRCHGNTCSRRRTRAPCPKLPLRSVLTPPPTWAEHRSKAVLWWRPRWPALPESWRS